MIPVGPFQFRMFCGSDSVKHTNWNSGNSSWTEKFSTLKMIKCWNRLARGVMVFPSLEIPNWATCFPWLWAGELDRVTFRGVFQPQLLGYFVRDVRSRSMSVLGVSSMKSQGPHSSHVTSGNSVKNLDASTALTTQTEALAEGIWNLL